MKRALVDPSQCQVCEVCAIELYCPQKAVIREDPSQTTWIDFYQCCGCMKCKVYCRFGAVEELMQPCTGTGRKSW